MRALFRDVAFVLSAVSFGVIAACGGAPPATHAAPSVDAHAADTPAVALARGVATAAGRARFGEVAQLRFRFVVTNGAERVADAFHRWDLRGARDHVTWTEDGHAYDVIVDLRARSATGTLDGAALTGPASQEAGAKAYERWVNDAYWLLLPLKLLDPGVTVTLEPAREHAGKQLEVLALQFAHVGLTPGDRYWLYVDPQTARIERWEMVLEGETTPPRGTSFARYTDVGPLHLALDHASDDGTKHILFEDVAAMSTVAAHDF